MPHYPEKGLVSSRWLPVVFIIGPASFMQCWWFDFRTLCCLMIGSWYFHFLTLLIQEWWIWEFASFCQSMFTYFVIWSLKYTWAFTILEVRLLAKAVSWTHSPNIWCYCLMNMLGVLWFALENYWVNGLQSDLCYRHVLTSTGSRKSDYFPLLNCYVITSYASISTMTK